jgi:hypothetical protein
MHILNIIIHTILLSNLYQSLELNGNFKYCDYTESSPHLTENESCKNKSQFHNIQTVNSFIILNKDDYIVNINAWRCKIVKATFKTYKNFFDGDELSYPPIIENLDISSDDCTKMSQTKLCFNKSLISFNNKKWSHIGIPERKYKRWTTLSFDVFYCFLDLINLKSNNLLDSLIEDAKYPCSALKLKCQAHDFMYVWNYTLQNCHLKTVKSLEMTITDNHILQSENLYFDLLEKIELCNVEVFKTQTGLYISNKINANIFLNTSIDFNIQHKLMIADLDHKFNKLSEDIVKLNLEFQVQKCLLFKNLINGAKQINTYYNFFDSNSNEYVIYNKMGVLIITNCIEITQFTINKIINNICYDKIQVSFLYKNIERKAFIDNNNILIPTANIINCNSHINTYLTQGELQRDFYNVFFTEKKDNQKIFNLIKLTNYNFGLPVLNHYKSITDNINIEIPILNDEIINSLDQNIIIQNSYDHNIYHRIIEATKNFIMYVLDYINWILFIIGLITIITITIIILSFIYCKCCFKNCKSQIVSNNDSDLELQTYKQKTSIIFKLFFFNLFLFDA